ncbi:hypothetical protein AYO49_05635 [Verrucomicrobiaceae bacterium SCGC AG-212-N21]|nr:hypothetical protein AYO49_05635 [Verrucomicrobiaceae bacterium SCGC AG-212-N21]
MKSKTEKPQISKKEASGAIAVAGAKAMRAAEAQGAPAEAIDALMDTGPLKVGDMILQPLSLPVLWALDAVGSAMIGEGEVAMRDVLIAVLCFVDPKEMRSLGRRGEKETIEARAEELAEKIPLDDLVRINKWTNGQFARLHALSGGDDASEAAAKKPSAPAAVMPTP